MWARAGLRLCVWMLMVVPLWFGAFVDPAAAISFGFGCITGNAPGDCAIGEAQLAVEVSDPGAGQALFTLTNTGPDASVVADVYFDDGVLSGIASITGSSGVSFSSPASPGNLPGGSSVSPPFLSTFSLDADPPPSQNGVDPGEQLAILFNLAPGATFADVLSNLNDQSLRVGLHVQAFASGGSESFINQASGTPIPEPSALVLLGAGSMLLAACLRR